MKLKIKITICCIVTAIVVQVVNYVNRMGPLWAFDYYNASFVSAKTDNAESFEKLIRDACYVLIETEGEYKRSFLSSYRSVWSYMTRDQSFNQYGYGEYALLMHYSFLYAQRKKDVELQELIRNKFDKGFRNNSGGGIIERNDQIAYGNVAIDLYKWTSDVYYKQFADKVFTRLDSIDNREGLVLYREGTTEQHVDAIGLVCPFLYYYANTFDSARAQDIGRKMCEEYVKWGTDPITGIPVQTYNINNHVKLNHANWGRGISWYLMGVSQMKSSDSIVNDRVSLLETTLLSQKNHLYSQYFSQGEIPDMSATIPVAYYLILKGRLSFSQIELTKLFSPYCDEDGIVRYCSPSITFPHKGVSMTERCLPSQAILLYMLSF